MSHEKMLKSAGLTDERVQLLEDEDDDIVFDLQPYSWPLAMPEPLDLISTADARLGPAVGLPSTYGVGDKLWSPAQRWLHSPLKRELERYLEEIRLPAQRQLHSAPHPALKR